MRAGVAAMSVVLLACPGRGQARAQAGNERQVLEQILTRTYQPSVVGKQLMGVGAETAVRHAGVIVVVQRPGLYASLVRNETASTAIHGLDAEVFRGNKDYAILWASGFTSPRFMSAEKQYFSGCCRLGA